MTTEQEKAMNLSERTIDELGDEITTLAAHINAATCRWLELVAEFDARDGWAEWGCRSCAHWISWRCSIAPGAAREHVRVARRLRDLPLTRAAFGRGELSFSKARALSRVEDVVREDELLSLARHSTAAQLERIVHGYRRVLLSDAERTHDRRFLSLIDTDDGSVAVRGLLSPEEGAVLRKALAIARELAAAPRAEAADVSAETCAERGAQDADALVSIADAALEAAATAGARSGGDRFQVVVHVDVDALGEPAGEGRSEPENGGPLASETARRLCCDASVVAIVERGGRPLSVGRKTRTIPSALRRALRSRDGGCRFPGCTQHRWVDAHHIQHWARGGETKLINLVQLCRHHHRLLHEGGFTIERPPGESLVFRRPDGRRLHPAPSLGPGDGRRLREDHAAAGVHVGPHTPVPEWYGERLDLGSAVDAVLATCEAASR